MTQQPQQKPTNQNPRENKQINLEMLEIRQEIFKIVPIALKTTIGKLDNILAKKQLLILSGFLIFASLSAATVTLNEQGLIGAEQVETNDLDADDVSILNDLIVETGDIEVQEGDVYSEGDVVAEENLFTDQYLYVNDQQVLEAANDRSWMELFADDEIDFYADGQRQLRIKEDALNLENGDIQDLDNINMEGDLIGTSTIASAEEIDITSDVSLSGQLGDLDALGIGTNQPNADLHVDGGSVKNTGSEDVFYEESDRSDWKHFEEREGVHSRDEDLELSVERDESEILDETKIETGTVVVDREGKYDVADGEGIQFQPDYVEFRYEQGLRGTPYEEATGENLDIGFTEPEFDQRGCPHNKNSWTIGSAVYSGESIQEQYSMTNMRNSASTSGMARSMSDSSIINTTFVDYRGQPCIQYDETENEDSSIEAREVGGEVVSDKENANQFKVNMVDMYGEKGFRFQVENLPHQDIFGPQAITYRAVQFPESSDVDIGFHNVSGTGDDSIDTGFQPDYMELYSGQNRGDQFVENNTRVRTTSPVSMGLSEGYIDFEDGDVQDQVSLSYGVTSDSTDGFRVASSDQYGLNNIYVENDNGDLHGRLQLEVTGTTDSAVEYNVDEFNPDESDHEHIMYRAFEFEDGVETGVGYEVIDDVGKFEADDLGFNPDFIKTRLNQRVSDINEEWQSPTNARCESGYGWSNGWHHAYGSNSLTLSLGRYAGSMNDHWIASSNDLIGNNIYNQRGYESPNADKCGRLEAQVTDLNSEGFEFQVDEHYIDEMMIYSGWRFNRIDEGERTAEPINLSSVRNVDESIVEFEAETPGDTDIAVETAVTSISNVVPPDSSFEEVNSGDSIPGISEGDSLKGDYLWLRQTLESNDGVNSPTLEEIRVEIKDQDSARHGIGTENPLARLHVSGDTAITQGNLGLGTANPTDRLEVVGDGRTSATFLEGNVGIGTSNPKGALDVDGAVSKQTGTFDIEHPDPEKEEEGYRLRHSFVESPTRGDNIYRYNITTNEVGEATIELPDYFEHLNEDVQIWTDTRKSFSGSYAEYVEDGNEVDVFTEEGKVKTDVLVVGTRKDQAAREAWDNKGVEYQEEVKDY